MNLTEIAQAIATILGCGVSADNTIGGSTYLTFDWGGKLWFTEAPGRIHISTTFPYSDGFFWGPSPNPHKISVAASKSAQQIARDIERRLLPEYKTAYLDAVRLMNEHNEAKMKREALAKKLTGILGIEVSKRDPMQFFCSNPVDIAGKVEWSDVSLRIRRSDERARRICREIVK
jgi:hypothetical protein